MHKDDQYVAVRKRLAAVGVSVEYVEEDNCDGVIEDALAEYKRVERRIALHLGVSYNRKRRNGVDRRNERAKQERRQRVVVTDRYPPHFCRSVRKKSDDEGGDEGACKRKQQNSAQIGKKALALE